VAGLQNHLTISKDPMIKSLNWKHIIILIGLIALVIYPVIHGSNYILHILNICLIWAVVAICWDLIVGYAGILSIGNIAFFAIGGYFSGVMAKTLGVPPWMCPIIAGLITMVIVTVVVGLPSLRLGGIYIALWSYMIVAVLPSVIAQTSKYTGGSNGLSLVPPFFEGMTRVHTYYINLVFFLVVIAIVYAILNSRRGLAFRAMRDSQDFAVSLGVSIYKEKITVFAISSLLTGIAGGFYVNYMTSISPAVLGSVPFTMVIAMILIGGIGRFPGAVIGTFVISFANEYLRLMGTWRLAVLGAVICLVILYFPGGFMEIADLIDRRFGKKEEDTSVQNLKTTERISNTN
jgi:branched-chain amino acid transport system permease protein